MQQWDSDIMHRKGTVHKVPDALSRMFDPGEEEIASSEEILDLWYLAKKKEVDGYPRKYKDWKVQNDTLYRHRQDPLLDPISNCKEIEC